MGVSLLSLLVVLAPRAAVAQAVDCRDQEPPLYAAITRGDLATVRALIRAGADLDLHCDYADGGDEFPLTSALALGRSEIAVALLDAGADPRRTRGEGAHALELAIDLGALPVVDRLLAAGVDPDGSTSPAPPLFRAAEADRLEIAERLLAAGADPDAHHGRRTVLEVASPRLRARLLAAGGDPGRRPSQQDIVMQAARYGQVTRELLAAGEVDRVAALEVAVSAGDPSGAFLLADGAAGLGAHPRGCAVLAQAAEANLDRVVGALLENNRDLPLECLQRARAAARPGSATSRVLASPPPPPPPKPAPVVTRSTWSPRDLCPYRQPDGAILCGIGVSAEIGYGPTGLAGNVDVALARGRWNLAGDLLELAAGYSFDRRAARVRLNYGYYILFFGAELGAAVRLPAPTWWAVPAATAGLVFVVPAARAEKLWWSTSLNLEVGLDGSVMTSLRLRLWRDLPP